MDNDIAAFCKDTNIHTRDNLERIVNEIAENTSCAFILFDFDGFSKIIDTFGKEKSDEILSIILKKIHHSLKASDFIGHIETDSFMICIKNVSLV